MQWEHPNIQSFSTQSNSTPRQWMALKNTSIIWFDSSNNWACQWQHVWGMALIKIGGAHWTWLWWTHSNVFTKWLLGVAYMHHMIVLTVHNGHLWWIVGKLFCPQLPASFTKSYFPLKPIKPITFLMRWEANEASGVPADPPLKKILVVSKL